MINTCRLDQVIHDMVALDLGATSMRGWAVERMTDV